MIWDVGCDATRAEAFGELKICALYLHWVDGSFWRWEFPIVWLVSGGKNSPQGQLFHRRVGFGIIIGRGGLE